MLLRFFLVVIFLFFASDAKAGMIDYPSVKLQALDKSTARTITLEAKVGSTIEYGSIFIKVQSCRKSEPLDTPESAAFLQIWEVPLNSKKSEWIFSGWMFASSPALSAMDHPVYDVWVLDCSGKEQKIIPIVEQDEKTEEPLEEDNKSEDEASKPRIIIDGEDVTGVNLNGEDDPTTFEAEEGVIDDVPGVETDDHDAEIFDTDVADPVADSEGSTALDAVIKENIGNF